MKPVIQALQKFCPNIIQLDYPVRYLNTIRIGGAADLFIEPTSIDELLIVLTIFRDLNQNFIFLGNGSNTILPDVVIHQPLIRFSKRTSQYTITGNSIEVDAGYILPKLAAHTAKLGLKGLEPLAGIPCTIGGAYFMNAGTDQGTIGDITDKVLVYNPDSKSTVTLQKAECQFGYRTSRFNFSGEIVLKAWLKLTESDAQTLQSERKQILLRRKAHFPLNYPNAGSVFKRPKDDYAGRVIEQCGLKGTIREGIQISEKHANFFINIGGGTQSGFRHLMDTAQEQAVKQLGIQLEPEVIVLDEWGRLRQ